LKSSRYNLFFKRSKNEFLLYNTLSGALLSINLKSFNEINAILNNNYIDTLNHTNTEIVNTLRFGGFLINDDVDELAIIYLRNMKARFNQDKYYYQSLMFNFLLLT
jgi:uncharacterized protein